MSRRLEHWRHRSRRRLTASRLHLEQCGSHEGRRLSQQCARTCRCQRQVSLHVFAVLSPPSPTPTSLVHSVMTCIPWQTYTRVVWSEVKFLSLPEVWSQSIHSGRETIANFVHLAWCIHTISPFYFPFLAFYTTLLTQVHHCFIITTLFFHIAILLTRFTLFMIFFVAGTCYGCCIKLDFIMCIFIILFYMWRRLSCLVIFPRFFFLHKNEMELLAWAEFIFSFLFLSYTEIWVTSTLFQPREGNALCARLIHVLRFWDDVMLIFVKSRRPFAALFSTTA